MSDERTVAPAIIASGVSKRFLLGSRSGSVRDMLTGFSDRSRDEFWAVKDVSVEVPKGSMLGVIGRNGSGKSTFLRMLSGIYRPTTGHIEVAGRVTALLELGAGFHQDLTGRENVYMNGAVVGLSRQHMDEVMDEIIAMADIGQFIDSPIETYSSGMRARLGFAVSVQLDPEILLADEITAVGDISFKEHGARRMNELRDRGVTIVQVSHNLPMLEQNSDQILWLHEGEVRGLGDPSEMIAEYTAFANLEADKDRVKKAESRSIVDEIVRPEWFPVVEVAPAGQHQMAPTGGTINMVIGLDVPTSVQEPELRARICRANGVAVGIGTVLTDFDGEPFSGTATVSGTLTNLPLVNGRYRFDVELVSGDEIVATRRVPLDVKGPESARDTLLDLSGDWSLRRTGQLDSNDSLRSGAASDSAAATST